MSKSDDYLLKAAKASTLRKQGDFVDAAKMAWAAARGEVKPGTTSSQPKAFTCLREFYKQSAQRPNMYQAQKYLRKETGLSEAHAKRLVKFYLLWECRSCVRLSPQDKAWIATNFPAVWKPFIKRGKLVEEHFAEMRAVNREVARLLTPSAPITSSPAVAPPSTTIPKSSRRTKSVTREWLIKQGFLTETD